MTKEILALDEKKITLLICEFTDDIDIMIKEIGK